MEETMLLGRRVGVSQATGYVMSAIGYAHRLSGDERSAISVIADAVDRFADLGDDLARAQALHQIGCTYRDSGDYLEARRALSLARELRLGLGDRRGELLTQIHVALLNAMAGDIDRGLDDARRSLSGFEANGDQVGMGAALTVLAAIELLSGEKRAAREMYRRAAERFAPWPRFFGWLEIVTAELSDELADHRRADREIAAAADIFDRTECVIAGRRLTALRHADNGDGVWVTSR
jgi:tetratricopeptide (TPR) repeat protein